jgi:4-hydroxy-tetrahydrodipicolinate reductase
MIADAVGWRIDRISDEIRAKVATVRTASRFLTVEPGHVSGIIQDGVGYRGSEALIRLHMEAYLGAPETFDEAVIEGSPRIAMSIPGGVHGDIATAAIVVNSIPKVLAAAPGLHTMRDLPLPSFFRGRLRPIRS